MSRSNPYRAGGGGGSGSEDDPDDDRDGEDGSGTSSFDYYSSGGAASSGSSGRSGGGDDTVDDRDDEDGSGTSSFDYYSSGGAASSDDGDNIADTEPEPAGDSSSGPSARPSLGRVDEAAVGGDAATGEKEPGFLEGLAQGYTENVARPTGEFVADATPATTIEKATLGTNRSERFIEGTATGVAQLGNIPGAFVGARDAGKAAVDARQQAFDPVTIGGVPTGVVLPNPEGQQELNKEAASTGAAAAGAAAENPFRTGGTIFGSLAGGVVGARGLNSALRRIDDVGGSVSGSSSSGNPVPTGRSNVGTGGRGSLLDADTVDDAMGVTGPSRRSVVSNRLDRALDGLQDRLDQSGLSDFASDRRGQLQTPRRGGDTGGSQTDFTDAPDRTRPPGAGGTFDDIRQDSLTQTQDALRDQARRPDPGDYEAGPDPFGPPARGPTLDPDTGVVELERTTGAAVDDAFAGTSGASGGGATATATGGTGGAFAGLGNIDPVNDPTGIAPISSPTVGTPAGTIGTPTDTVGDGGFGGGAANLDDILEGDGTATDVGVDGGVDGTIDFTTPTDTVLDDGTDTGVGGDADTGTGLDTGTGTGFGGGPGGGTDLDTGIGTDTPLDTATDTDGGLQTDTPTPPTTLPPGTRAPPQERTPRGPPRNTRGPPGGGFGGGRPPFDLNPDTGGFDVGGSELGFTTDDDLFETGVADPGDALDDLFGDNDDEEFLFGEDDRKSGTSPLGSIGGGSGSSGSILDGFDDLL